MPTLLQINTTVNYGSTGRIAENIGLAAINQGWDSYIVHGPRFTNPSRLTAICTESPFEEKIHGIKSLFFDEHGLGSKRATIRTIEKIKKIDPDIIHLHNIHGYYLNYPILFPFLKALGKPVVWTFHDCWNFTGHCAYFDLVGCNKWQSGCEHCPNISSYPRSLIDRAYRNFELKTKYFSDLNSLTIIPVSKWLDGLIEKSFLSCYERKVLYNGIDISLFQPQYNGVDFRKKFNIQDKFIVLGVATPWSERKGLQDFIQLSKLISEDAQIILVGVSKEQQKMLPSNIIGIERTDNIHQLAEIYSTVDLFFNPTWEDNFPTTNIEALACGTPVVTYRTGGSPEALSPETGFVIDQGAYKQVLDIIKVIRDKGKNFYSISCRKRAVSLFNKDDRYNDYIQLYNKLLNK